MLSIVQLMITLKDKKITQFHPNFLALFEHVYQIHTWKLNSQYECWEMAAVQADWPLEVPCLEACHDRWEVFITAEVHIWQRASLAFCSLTLGHNVLPSNHCDTARKSSPSGAHRPWTSQSAESWIRYIPGHYKPSRMWYPTKTAQGLDTLYEEFRILIKL